MNLTAREKSVIEKSLLFVECRALAEDDIEGKQFVLALVLKIRNEVVVETEITIPDPLSNANLIGKGTGE